MLKGTSEDKRSESSFLAKLPAWLHSSCTLSIVDDTKLSSADMSIVED